MGIRSREELELFKATKEWLRLLVTGGVARLSWKIRARIKGLKSGGSCQMGQESFKFHLWCALEKKFHESLS
jgi:hypothetical protein